MTNEKMMAEYLLLIKKQVNYSIKTPEHLDFKEDIAQDVFLKLYKADFFGKYLLENEEESLIASSYIKKTISSCYLDFLQKARISHRLTQKEKKLNPDQKYRNIRSVDIEDIESSLESSIGTAEQYLMAKQAYQIIKECFQAAMASISNPSRVTFLKEAFWELDKYSLPIKKLAEFLGYDNSNPTQDFNRFVQKVSECTEPSGINVVNPSEQIEFLKQIVEIDGVTA